MTQSNSIGPDEPPPPAADLNALSEKITQLERVVRGMGRDSLEASRAQREAQELLQKLQTQLDEMRLESKGILQTVWRTSQESQISMTKAEDHFGAAIRELEARLTVLACSAPPAGQRRWTLRLLAEQLVALEYVDEVSHVTVGEWLKKTHLSLGA